MKGKIIVEFECEETGQVLPVLEFLKKEVTSINVTKVQPIMEALDDQLELLNGWKA